MGDGPEDRQFDPGSVPEFAAGLGFDVEKPAVNSPSHGGQNVQDIILDNVADADEKLRRAGELGAEPAVDLAEHRDDLDQQKNGNPDGDDRHRGGVHHGGFDFFSQPGGVFQVGRQARQHLGQQSALFTRVHHADKKFVENF